MYVLPSRTWKKRCGSGSSVASADSVMLSMDHWDTGSPLPTLEGSKKKQAGCAEWNRMAWETETRQRCSEDNGRRRLLQSAGLSSIRLSGS